MKKNFGLAVIVFAIFTLSCTNENKENNSSASNSNNETAVTTGGQENVKDDVSQKDVVKVAAGSKDHTTLVAAIKQAELISSLSNAGPFTVFAPTNAAFDKLPAGTVDKLMKNENKADLQDILQYHVTTSSLKAEYFTDGMNVGMVNGGNVTVSVKDGKIMLNGTATIVASIPASNGTVHVIDGVLLPPATK
ncbi:MAG TPA: fasciclin domain-containing protein [Chitinophagaceae bacterium]|nr:fasciclin domain-containing protein [Chitinophagaceae bacterium]